MGMTAIDCLSCFRGNDEALALKVGVLLWIFPPAFAALNYRVDASVEKTGVMRQGGGGGPPTVLPPGC